jgi:hypothetical protein
MPKVFNNHKVRWYWSIWALGYHLICNSDGKWSELQFFIGPAVITFWR